MGSYNVVHILCHELRPMARKTRRVGQLPSLKSVRCTVTHVKFDNTITVHDLANNIASPKGKTWRQSRATVTAYQKVTRREYRRCCWLGARRNPLRKKKKIQKNVSTNNNYHKEKRSATTNCFK
jgi:hypothetical protein